MVKCLICNSEFGNLINHLIFKHKLHPKDYRKIFPFAPIFSEDQIRQIAKSNMGKKRSDETRKKMSKSAKLSWARGRYLSSAFKKHSEETKKKQSEKLKEYHIKHPDFNHVSELTKGKNHSLETKKKISKARIKGFLGGRIIPWNLGKTAKEDPRILSGEKNGMWKGGKRKKKYVGNWASIRKKIIDEHPFCSVCGKENVLLDIHHLDGDSLNNNLNNLVVVCHSCHPTLEKKEENDIKEEVINQCL